MRPLLLLLLLLAALAALGPRLAVEALRFGAGTHQEAQTGHTGSGKHERRPQSSSSLLADIEDLTDSSVRTRLGTVNIEHLGTAPDDFDQLIERLVPPSEAADKQTGGGQQLQQQQQQLVSEEGPNKVSADANNKTSMRFFRNSKTFASIVYTNPMQAGQRQARRLINCHLVDMERHASDVAIYEAKYDIRTIDIEFKEMMQLIEACTNIARLRRRPLNAIGQQPGAPGSQYRTGGQKHAAAQPASGLLGSPLQSAVRPMIVVGRPAAGLAPSIGGQSGSQQPGGSQDQALFRQVMSSALQKELSQLDGHTTRDDSPHLDLPQSPIVFTEMHNHHQTGFNLNLGGSNGASSTQRPHHHHSHRHHPQQQQHQQHNQHQQQQRKRQYAPTSERIARQRRGRFDPLPTPELYANLSRLTLGKFRRQLGGASRHALVGALARVGEQSKRLVLGEVTAPPSLTISGSGAPNGSTALRDALQEISSYDTSDLLSIWRGILPGTNWCGMGDRATSYNDLGFESDIDICCRAHDFCPVRLSAFTSGYGLFNWSFYTRSHCWCDQNFLDCLQLAESPLSAVVMKFYFSIMKTTCLNDVDTEAQPAHQQAANKEHSLVASHPPGIPALHRSQWLQTRQEPKARRASRN